MMEHTFERGKPEMMGFCGNGNGGNDNSCIWIILIIVVLCCCCGK